MPAAHRHGDARQCGATTIVEGQTTVYANDKLWSVEGDPNSHGGGALIPTVTTVFNEDKPVIVHSPDPAEPDILHPPPPTDTGAGSGDVFAG